MGLSYSDSGVDYTPLDAFKRACQAAAATTVGALKSHGLTEPADTRGDSAYLLEAADHYLAHVEEGLGTKNLVADAMAVATGQCYYRAIGIDTVATIVNDLITCGALPISVAMHAAVGDSAWFSDRNRAGELAAGFADGCKLAGAVWGGGETPALPGIVTPEGIVLAGSAVGQIMPKSRRVRPNLQDGDQIVFIASSGIQTNGLSLARLIAGRQPKGYLTPVGQGTLGELLLAPSVIYVDLVRDLLAAGIVPAYLAHITGHGWRKVMRAPQALVYRIHTPGEIPPLFAALMTLGPVSVEEAYATFNMGAGFALYLRPADVKAALATAAKLGHRAWLAGEVVDEGGRQAVEIPGLGITFAAESLKLR